MTQTVHRIKWDHFDILATGKSDIHCKMVLLQQTVTWYKIRHAGGQAHYYSRTGTLKQRDLNQSSVARPLF